MISFVVKKNMWQKIIFSILCFGSFKFTVAEGLPYGQEVIGQLKYPPSVRVPLPYFPSSSNYLLKNFGEENNFEVPWIYTKVNRQIEEPRTSSNNCPQLETLQNILILLKRLLSQGDNSYLLQPYQRIQILKSLKEFLEKSDSNLSGIDNHLKLRELLNHASEAPAVENDTTRLNTSNNNNIEANFILKYNIPNIKNLGCKEALATLFEIVKNVHLQLIHFCTQSGKCKLNAEPDSVNLQQYDKPNILDNSLPLDNSIPTQSKMTLANQHSSLNIHDIQSSINNLLIQNSSNAYLVPDSNHQSNLNSNQFFISNSLDSDLPQTQNIQDKYIDNFNNINLNKDLSQSNIQHSAKSNVLNNVLNFNNPIPTEVKITPPHLHPMNINDVQRPLSNLVMPRNQGIIEKGSNDYLNLPLYSESYLDNNKFITTSTLNSGVVQNKNLNNQENNYINNFDNNNQYIRKFIPINYNNEPSQQLPYKHSKIFNDENELLAMIEQNKQNVNKRDQFEGASIPRQEYNKFSYLSLIKPSEIKSYIPENLILSNFENFQNQNMKQVVDPSLYSNLNIKQNPYLSSMNLNRQNSLNYNSQQAQSSFQNNLGLNFYRPINLVQYPNHDINGNSLFDSHRFASEPNLVKLNSVADNEGIVELTYKLKRPETIIYNPYYYVKFRMPYRNFVSKIVDIFRNPQLRTNPVKLHEELLSLSNVGEASPDLKNVQSKEVSKLILHNGGTLINARVLGINDFNADKNLEIIQNVNAKLKMNDILNFGKRDNTLIPTTPLHSGNIIFRPEQNSYFNDLSYQNLNPQNILDEGPRRLFNPLAQYDSKALPMLFLPAKIASPFLSNPDISHTIYPTLNSKG